MKAKMNYTTLIGIQLMKMHANPGDIFTLAIRNEESDDGMFAQAKRLQAMFLSCYSFWPQSIAVHPTHFSLIRQMGKSLDITFSEQGASMLGSFFELAELPTQVALVADETLDLFTCVARFEFREEDMKQFASQGLDYLLDALKGEM